MKVYSSGLNAYKLAVFSAKTFCPLSQALAKYLSVPYCIGSKVLPEFEWYFQYNHQNRLMLGQVGSGMNPLMVDFAGGKQSYRLSCGGGVNQSLIKAVGLKDKPGLYIVDATAGLGSDAFVMASLGGRVTMIERNPLIALLLSEGLAQDYQDKKLFSILQRMRGVYGQANDWLNCWLSLKEKKTLKQNVDVLYLDPMFPEKSKGALVKKNMQMFRSLIGKDIDSQELLELGLSLVNYRVVVKRPRLAPFLADKVPSYQLIGKSNRFDIYVKASIKKKP